MKRYTGFFTVLAILVCTLVMVGCEQKPKATASSPALNLQDGLWEITTLVDAPGMPAGMIKPYGFNACLSQKDAVPKGKDQTDCTTKDMKTEGNTVSWTVVCKDATSKGKITYAGGTFDGIIESTMKQEDGKVMPVKMTMKGKRLGPCPPK
jgi:hypothetical protein